MNTFQTFAGLGFSALALLVVLVLALLLSSYVKIATVLGIVRVGLGAGSLPSAFITAGLALVLSFFVMYPTILNASRAMGQVSAGQVSAGQAINDSVRARALSAGLEQWRLFLVRHTHQKEKEQFARIANELDREQNSTARAAQSPQTSPDSWRVLAPAFMVSELKEAFATGLSLFLPFLVIDLLVAHVLLAVGIERSSALVVSFPFKLMLFVMVDGWSLITANLVAAYG